MKIKIIQNILWLIGEKGGQVIAGIVISGILARGLGIEMFGALQYALALILLFSSLSYICGIEVVLPRLVSMSESEKSELVSTAFVLRLISAFIGAVTFFLYLKITITDSFTSTTLLFLSIIILVREPFNIIVNILQARTDEKIAVLIRLTALVIKLAGIALCYHFSTLTSESVAFLWLLEALLVATVLLLLIKLISPEFRFKFSLQCLKKLLSQGTRFWLGLVFMYLFLRVDRIFLQHFTDLKQVGLYSAAMQISDSIASLAPIIAIATAPALIYCVKSIRKLKFNVLVLTFIMASIGVVITIAGLILSDYIIEVVFGPNYISSACILKMTLCVTIFVFIDAGLNTFIIKYGNGNIIIYKWILALSVSILTNIILINIIGVWSVIIANAAGYFIAIIFGLFYIFKFDDEA